MVVAAIAKRYGHRREVIGWQIDNEFGGGKTARCYCPNCVMAFRTWLKSRYSRISDLNDSWGTVFWSQTYADWDEIHPPAPATEQANPSHVLDYYRFSSDSWVAYQQLQVDLLKSLCSQDQFVTHNLMGLFHDLDYHKLAAPLDLVTWDSYPSGHLDRWRPLCYPPDSQIAAVESAYAYDVGEPVITQMGHDLTRGLKKAPFWVMEQQCGQINWGSYNPGIRPGTTRLWSWHSAASGATGIIFFRWRACLYAQEQFHSGLLHHDARPDVGYQDLLVLQQEKEQLAEIARQPFDSQVALLFDYNDLWAIQIQPHRQNFSYLRHAFAYYQALSRLGVNVDIVSPQTDLTPYRLVVSPTSLMGHPELALRLMEFVSQGGSILLGVRSGYNTPTKIAVDQPLPGYFRDLVGTSIGAWHSLPPGIGYTLSSEIPGLSGQATVWAEAIDPAKSVESLASYRSGPFNGLPALSEHSIGWGRAYYCGFFPEPSQALALMRYLVNRIGIPNIPRLHESVIAIRRGPYTVLLNFSDHPHSIELINRSVTVQPRDISIVRSDFPR
jgi:beta-galactosidase